MDVRLESVRGLSARGKTRHEIERAKRTGELVKVRRSWVRQPAELDVEQAHLLLVRSTLEECHPESVVSHGSAAVVHGLPVRRTDFDHVYLTRSGGSHGRTRSVVSLRAAPLAADEVVTVGGVSVTSVPRTAADLARGLPFEWGVIVMDAALHGGFDREELAEQVERYPSWRGIERARAALAFADPRAESPLESLSRVQFVRIGVPPPDELQYAVYDGGVLRGVGDFWWEEHRLIGEADGKVKYRRYLRVGETPEGALLREKNREWSMRDLGLNLVRWDWETACSPERLQRRILTAMRQAA